MTEAILIEICQRFRKLEDAVEDADKFHARYMARLQGRIDANDAAHAAGKIDYKVFCRVGNVASNEREAVRDARADMDKALEACREDLVGMQEEIRKAGER